MTTRKTSEVTAHLRATLDRRTDELLARVAPTIARAERFWDEHEAAIDSPEEPTDADAGATCYVAAVWTLALVAHGKHGRPGPRPMVGTNEKTCETRYFYVTVARDHELLFLKVEPRDLPTNRLLGVAVEHPAESVHVVTPEGQLLESTYPLGNVTQGEVFICDVRLTGSLGTDILHVETLCDWPS